MRNFITGFPFHFVGIVDVIQVVSTFTKCRILTNCPNVDRAEGINAFATLRIAGIVGDLTFTDPLAAAGQGGERLYEPNDRFILIYDPRSTAGVLSIMELEISDQVNLTVYAFETYGYFWDRAVMHTPGRPRHP